MKFILLSILFFYSFNVSGQNPSGKISNKEIMKVIADFKKDERGPYQAIRWFCTDGTILPPKERCPQPGGIQHALPKDIINQLAAKNGIYLGQILAGTDFTAFWDSKNANAQIKQYILEQYLQSIDDGWIMRRGRYYRGAVQAEDESEWGHRFLLWLSANDENLKSHFFLARQACRYIPHNASDKLWERIRAVSKILSDSLESFTKIRVKLHGQPEESDLQKVQNFRKQYNSKIGEDLIIYFNQLEMDLKEAYKPINTSILRTYLKNIPSGQPIYSKITRLINLIDTNNTIGKDILKEIIQLLLQCRQEILISKEPPGRLALLDLSITLETLLFQYSDNWKTNTTTEMLEKADFMIKAITACGFLELWEYEHIRGIIKHNPDLNNINIGDLQLQTEYIKRAADWGSSMVRSMYQDVVSTFAEFEPLAAGFIDDRIRVSVLLTTGNIAGELAQFYSKKAGITNHVLNIPSQNQVRGLNSGYALGEIVVLQSVSDDMDFDPDKIYVLAHPPADLKPVAGILSVSEGNLVSHVQLLARNLGIPNAVISSSCFSEMLPYAGKRVFYAVSAKGAVIVKAESEMNSSEQNLFKKNQIREEKFMVPVDNINTKESGIINLRDLRAASSGILTGPKAANLGELKYLFPDNVVEGFAIPFGSYRKHLDQQMPEKQQTYWQFLNGIFKNAGQLRISKSEKEADEYILAELAILRDAIKNIIMIPQFKEEIKTAFIEILGKPVGQIAVFIRSDTNMEDLKDFTGAGLNLTVFNVKNEEAVWQGIRDVWASPFSERSYKWRQRLLLNPENVFPSILIIPSVNNDKSGVMITTGVYTGNKKDITVAFNRGSGGAVEGQLAETYTITNNGKTFLLNPGRELYFTSLPENGGTEKLVTTFNKPILTKNNLTDLLDFSNIIINRMKEKRGFDKAEPLDIELGFKDDKIWLFQIRPFVESKKAKSTLYLNKMDPVIDKSKLINLDQDI